MSTDGRWLEIAVEADQEAVEPVSEIFARFAYNGSVAIEEPYTQDADGDNFAIDATRPVILRAYLVASDAAAAIVSQIEQALWHLNQMRYVGPLTVTERQEDEWANAWKEHYHVHRLGRHLVIRPSWRPFEREPDDVVISLTRAWLLVLGSIPAPN